MTGTRYVDGTYQEENPDWHAEDAPFKAKQVLKMLGRHGLAPETIAEIGCGSGQLLRELHDALSDTTRLIGYDIAPAAIELCRPRATERLAFELGCGWDRVEEPFDLILLMDVIEHVEDYFSLLRAAKQHARRLLLHIPLDLSVQSVLRATPLAHVRETVGHLHYFTKETALATLRDVDCEILDWSYTAPSTALPARSAISAMARGPRRALFALRPDWAARILGGYSMLVLAR